MQKILTERPNLFETNNYISFYIEISDNRCAEDLRLAKVDMTDFAKVDMDLLMKKIVQWCEKQEKY